MFVIMLAIERLYSFSYLRMMFYKNGHVNGVIWLLKGLQEPTLTVLIASQSNCDKGLSGAALTRGWHSHVLYTSIFVRGQNKSQRST